MYNKSMRRSRLARTILAGTLGAVLAATSAVTAFADEIIVEDVTPDTEDVIIGGGRDHRDRRCRNGSFLGCFRRSGG